jgi:hypothetical protein
MLLKKSWCWSSDLRCLLKCPCVEGLFPRVAPLEGSGTFTWLGLVGGLLVIGGMLLKGIMGPQPCFFLFLCILKVKWAALLCYTLPLWCAFLQKAESNRSNSPWTETSRPFLFISYLSQGFVTVTERWLTLMWCRRGKYRLRVRDCHLSMEGRVVSNIYSAVALQMGVFR